jgi:hypothetical protein
VKALCICALNTASFTEAQDKLFFPPLSKIVFYIALRFATREPAG